MKTSDAAVSDLFRHCLCVLEEADNIPYPSLLADGTVYTLTVKQASKLTHKLAASHLKHRILEVFLLVESMEISFSCCCAVTE